MKKITSLALVLFAFITVDGISQDKKPASPKETVETTLDGTKTTIVYSRPSAKGRKVMGELVPFGKVWRTGANAATTIKFDNAVKIEGKNLAAGEYALFTIPGEAEWVIIFSKVAKQNGAFNYKEADDALRVTVKPSKVDFTETFTISAEKESVILKWENTQASFKVKKG